MFYDAITEAYPHLVVLSSTVELDPIPEGAALDYHDYGVSDRTSVANNNLHFFQSPHGRLTLSV